MGLSIHYNGTIRQYSLIDELTEEVADICKDLNWPYNIWENKESADTLSERNNRSSLDYKIDDLKGISVSPEESETLFLTFLPNRALYSPIKLIYNDPVTNDLMIETIHTKTQYAGPDTHMAIVNLLRYLNRKYFSELEVNDEGMYWESQDKAVLHSQFAKYNDALNMLTDALTDFKGVSGETATSLADRLEQFLLKKLGGNLRAPE
jgi:hypothetical protein